MSIIDDDEVLNNLIKNVRKQIGENLSDLPNSFDQEGNPIKSVIKDIQNGVKPDFPYIVISLLEDNESQGSWERHTYIDEDDKLHHVVEESLVFKLICYGENATTILKKLKIYTLDDDIRDQLNITTNVKFIDFSDITRRPEYLSTDFVNTAFMTATFTAVSDWFNPEGGGVIENVTGEASYLRHDGDDNPISVPIDTTSS